MVEESNNSAFHLSKHMRDVFFGGNWSTSNLQEQLKDVTFEQAKHKIFDFNTILTLTYHIGYYVKAVSSVLEGEGLNAKDEYSFSHPEINSEAEWQAFVQDILNSADHFSRLINSLDESILGDDFTDAKYGTYFRNLLGIIEHTHYHLGQIAIIKKIIAAQ